MSNNNIHTDKKPSKIAVRDDALERQSSTTVELTPSGMYDKQQSLVELANNTFRELCKTLENEQAKLLELEEKRKKLQEEMELLKAEIEEEKESYEMDIVQSVAENLSALNKSCDRIPEVSENLIFKKLITCHEDDKDFNITVGHKNSSELMNDEPTIDDQTQHIRNELQSIVTECSIEQCTDKSEESLQENKPLQDKK